jgi:hypothetical protein
VALGCALAIVGIVAALIWIRRNEHWALWTSFATLIILLVTRLTADSRCLAVLDPTPYVHDRRGTRRVRARTRWVR